jgi:hypothetical protein
MSSGHGFYPPFSSLRGDEAPLSASASASAGQTQGSYDRVPYSPQQTGLPGTEQAWPTSARQATVAATSQSSSHPSTSHSHHLAHSRPAPPVPPPISPPSRLPDFWSSVYAPPASRGQSFWDTVPNLHDSPTQPNPAGRSNPRLSPSFHPPPTAQPPLQTSSELPFAYTLDFDSSRSNSPAAMPSRDRRPSVIETNARNRPAISTKRPQRPVDEPESSGANKRTRPNVGDSSTSRRRSSSAVEIIDIDAVDEGDAMEETLAKQRQEQVRTAATGGNPGEDERRYLTKMTCVICLESPTDLTATNCGKSRHDGILAQTGHETNPGHLQDTSSATNASHNPSSTQKTDLVRMASRSAPSVPSAVRRSIAIRTESLFRCYSKKASQHSPDETRPRLDGHWWHFEVSARGDLSQVHWGLFFSSLRMA